MRVMGNMENMAKSSEEFSSQALYLFAAAAVR